MYNKNNWVIISAVSGFIAVALGAFGGHALKSIISPEMLEIYKIGVLYHLIHSAVMLAVSLSAKERAEISLPFFLIGIILFSCSLYLFTLTEISFFVYVTPFGGFSLLLGWAALVYSAVKKNKTIG